LASHKTTLTPEQRSLRARQAAFTMHSQHDPKETTAAGRAAFLGRFVDLVDPDRVLDETERNRRAESARKAHFTGLALKSSKARRARSA